MNTGLAVSSKKLASSDWVSLTLLLGMVLGFAQEMVWSNQLPFFRDLGPYFYPLRFILAESFKAGEIPLWDRHIGMGFPFLAEFQSGVFYPPHVFYLLLPFFAAIKVSFLFHYCVAALGSYLLLRRWAYPACLSLVGAILFTFGGVIVSLTNLLNHFQTAVWLPWIILLGERSLVSYRWKDLVAFTLASLVQFLAGSPEIYAMSVGLLLLDFLRIRSEDRGITYWRVLSIPTAANALMVGLAMVQVLPTAELFLESRWGRPVEFSEAALYSFHPFNLLNLFFLDREVAPTVISGLRLFFLRNVPLLVTYYMGAICFLGLFFWLFFASWKEKALVLSLAAVSIVLAMGTYTPIYPFIYKYLPLLSFFRFTEKFFFLTYSLILFAALRGLYALVEPGETSLRKLFFILLSALSLYLLPYLLFRFDTEPLRQFITGATGIPLFSSATIAMTSAIIANLERQIALTVGIGLLFFLWKMGKLQNLLFQVLLVGLVVFDLASAHRPYQYFLNPEFIDKNPRVLPEPEKQPYRFFYYPGPRNLHPSYYDFRRNVSIEEFNQIVFSNLLPNAGVLYGFDYMQELDALRRGRYVDFLGIINGIPPENQYRLITAFNVKYLISLQPLPEEGIRLVRHFPEYPSWLYRIERPVPRAYVVHDVVVEKDRIQVVGRLSGRIFDPLKKVIVEQPLSMPAKDNFKGRAEIVQYKNQEVTIRASLNGSGFLVLADSFYPGWRAYVDGKETKILRANFFFRGVPLQPGDHWVEFRYRPRSFTVGLVISVATAIGMALGSAFLVLKNRRKA